MDCEKLVSLAQKRRSLWNRKTPHIITEMCHHGCGVKLQLCSKIQTCVRKKGDYYYFPKSIPRERDSITISLGGLLTAILLVHFLVSDNLRTFLGFYALVTCSYLLVNYVYRLILYIFELKHVRTRYENDKNKILKSAFYFEAKMYLLAVLCLFYLVYFTTRHGSLPSLRNDHWFLMVPYLFVLHRLLNLEDFPLNDSLWIDKEHGLNYGSGMAYSFFYGYLKYMLEKTGEPNKNLKEMMEDYEAKNHITFAVYKIFILIPKSLTCFQSIHNVSRIMEMRSTLPLKSITVAGVRDRKYQNSVYTIKRPNSDNQIVYVCTEYASPLKTFKEVYSHNNSHTKYYLRHRDDILLQFYLTLKHILDDHSSLSNMCELVFYEDMDEQNNYYDVGRILLNKIAEIRKSQSHAG